MSLTEMTRAARRGTAIAADPVVVPTPPPAMRESIIEPSAPAMIRERPAARIPERYDSDVMDITTAKEPLPTNHATRGWGVKRGFSIPALCAGVIAAIGVIKLVPKYQPRWFEDKKSGEISKMRVHLAGAVSGVVVWGLVQLALTFRK